MNASRLQLERGSFAAIYGATRWAFSIITHVNRITNEKHSVFCQQESRSVSEFIFFFLLYCLHYFIVSNYLDYRHHYDASNKRILVISILRTRYFQLALAANNSAHCSIQLATASAAYAIFV